ncbi:hypothetical protein HMPREF1141_1102 [Clostridium sp. MSTE9]|uniref:hypothetical protein n=1 Tax=Clostridium sp. (strain MSTE9) TaxID=1105031 RepID=UPI00026F1AE1|nr:hypothetical protein [Clostridium sp. MSTE9]EJF40885.1 hypothetical protein HMPREF1141_1102 [Clostridium sp. MSTE9]
MQLALRSKQLLVKRIATLLMVLVVFCSPLVKPPVKVEAAVIPVVAGAAVVATALTMLGIGVAAGFDSEAYATATQKIWDGLSSATKQAIILTELAGTTVAHYTEQALRDIFAGAQATFPQAGSAAYSNSGAFKTADDAYSWFSSLGVIDLPVLLDKDTEILRLAPAMYGDVTLSLGSMSNYRYLGNFTIPASNVAEDEYVSFALPYDYKLKVKKKIANGLSFYQIGSVLFNDKTVSRYTVTRSLETPGVNTSYSSLTYLDYGQVFKVIAFDIVTAGVTYFVLFDVDDRPLKASAISFNVALSPDVIPVSSTPDVFNPADAKFYADGMSTLNHKLDDVLNRLKERVGETGQISDMPDAITIPGRMADQQVSDKTKSQDQATTIGNEIATAEDKAANDATNVDRDTTKPSTDTPSTDIPDLSIPQIITNKFPFSIPWDLYNSVRILVAPAAAPKWVLPLRFDKLGVNTSITIDMAQFDGLAALSRWGLSLLFIISLIILSSKLVKR